jgi:hypothetical protein
VIGYVVKASCTGGTTPHVNRVRTVNMTKPLNVELNPICHLLALLAHRIFHVSRIRVNIKPLGLPDIFLKRFIAQRVYTGCARINYIIVPVTNLNKY